MCAHTLRARSWALAASLGLVLTVAPTGTALAAAREHITAGAVPAVGLACSSTPPAGPVVEAIGWPQARYDLPRLGRISQGEGIIVAVLDSGVDPAHPQLAGAVLGGGDTLGGGGHGLVDCVGHGTAVASIIAARPVPGAGLRGVAPGTSILSIRVSSRVETSDGYVGTGDVAALVAGIYRAVAARPQPRVLNLSLSTTIDAPALRAAIGAALAADIVVVASAGNAYDRGNPTPYPAGYAGVVGVGAIDATGARLPRSQVGGYVDIVAPGEGVLAAAPGSGHGLVSGTSVAVPYVAGTAALIRARWPALDRTAVVRRLLATADPPAGGQPSPDYGRGVVNPLRALTEVLPPVPTMGVMAPGPVVRAGTAGDGPASPSAPVLAAAGLLLLATVFVTALALVTPAGRRRRWRPGRGRGYD